MQKELGIFMATHSKKCEQIAEWIIPIQVGAAFKTNYIEQVVDCTQDHISHKNKSFCEITALYWMWKNTQYHNIGLYHYRRRFALEKEQIFSLLSHSDIILPKEKKLRISVEEQYIKEHGNEDWNKMLQVLQKRYPEYYESSRKIFKDNKLYKYNMFITNRQIFESYCDWLFPILFEIEKETNSNQRNSYQMRYIGFLAERLFTLYIKHNHLQTTEVETLFENKKNNIEKLVNFINEVIFSITSKIKRR